MKFIHLTPNIMFKKLFQKDNELKSASTSEYSPEIEQIHNEFNMAGETLLKEALAVLEDCKTKDLTKGELLASLGFTQTPQASAAKEIKVKKALAEDIAELVQKYSLRYPNNKFITESVVGEICKKYNLVCGDVSLYKAFVPQIKLDEIIKFKLKKEDYTEMYCYDGSWNTVKFWMNRHRRPRDYFNEVSDDFSKFKKEVQSLKICAPIKDMDTRDMALNGYHLEKHIPDPIVLQPVDGGYLIVTMWGPESSDELVVNERHN